MQSMQDKFMATVRIGPKGQIVIPLSLIHI